MKGMHFSTKNAHLLNFVQIQFFVIFVRKILIIQQARTDKSNLHLDAGRVLDHLELRMHRFDDGLEVLPRVGVLHPRVSVRKERKVWREIFEVLGVVGKLGGEVLQDIKF